MKTISIAWRSLAALFVILFMLTSCEEDKDEPAPDLATQVAGTYQYKELSYDGTTIPGEQTNLKGTIRISAVSATEVKIRLDIRLKSTNEEFMVIEASGVNVVKSGDTIDLFYDSERIAGVKGNKITLNGVDEDGVDFTISGVK